MIAGLPVRRTEPLPTEVRPLLWDKFTGPCHFALYSRQFTSISLLAANNLPLSRPLLVRLLFPSNYRLKTVQPFSFWRQSVGNANSTAKLFSGIPGFDRNRCHN
jgi:hypothetical protein